MPSYAYYLIVLIPLVLVLISLFIYQGIRYTDLFFSYKHNPDEKKRKPLHSPDHTQVLFYDKKWFASLPFEEKNIVSYDGLKLHGYYYKNPKNPDKLVISVHGYRGTYLELSEQDRFFQEQLGYSILMIDQRAQGHSEGKYITFGDKERHDVLSWCNAMAKENPEVQIVLLGFSMGAATVLMSMSLNLPENVKCIIADSSYTSTKEEINYVGKSKYKKGYISIGLATRVFASLRCHFSYTRSTPVKSIASNTRFPVLLIQGEEDTYVPFSMGKELLKAANKQAYVDYFSVKGAWHGMSFQVNPSYYQQQVASFVRKFIK